MKKIISVLLLVSIIALTGCGDEVVESNKDTKEVVEKIEELKDTTIPETRQDEIKVLIKDIVDEHYNRTSVKDITINEHLGTDEEDDYLTLIYLSFDAMNKAKTAKEMIDMYSSDLGTRLADERDISEIAIFWEVPYLKEGSNIVKFNLQRTGDKMAFEDKWYDNSIFN